MTHDDGIIKGEARDGVTGSQPRPHVALPDPDALDVSAPRLASGTKLVIVFVVGVIVGAVVWLLG